MGDFESITEINELNRFKVEVIKSVDKLLSLGDNLTFVSKEKIVVVDGDWGSNYKLKMDVKPIFHLEKDGIFVCDSSQLNAKLGNFNISNLLKKVL